MAVKPQFQDLWTNPGAVEKAKGFGDGARGIGGPGLVKP